MHITMIGDKNRDYFAHVCPENLLSDESFLHLGAISDGGEGCAVLSASVADNMAHIEWLFTDPDMREQGAAGSLIEMLVDIAEEMGLNGVDIAFTDSDENLGDFITEAGFLTGIDSGIYEVPVSDLIYTPEMDEIIEASGTGSGVYTLNSKKILSRMPGFLEDHVMDSDILDDMTPDISPAVCDEDGNIAGCMLMKDEEDYIEIEHLIGDEDVYPGLAAALYDLLNDPVNEYTYVRFTDRDGRISRFVEGLTGIDIDEYRVEGAGYGVRLFELA